MRAPGLIEPLSLILYDERIVTQVLILSKEFLENFAKAPLRSPMVSARRQLRRTNPLCREAPQALDENQRAVCSKRLDKRPPRSDLLELSTLEQ